MKKFKFESFPNTYGRVREVYRNLPDLIKRGKAISEDIASRNAESDANYSPEYYLGDTQDALLARLYNLHGEDPVLWALGHSWMDEGCARTIDEVLKAI
jgi:hypothetical protein